MSANLLTSDEQVEENLRRVMDGETECYEPVIRRFERPLRAWLATQALPGIDVDEIAQQSFVAAYLRLNEYEPGSNFSAWLHAIARYQLKTETTRLRRIADYRVRFASDLFAKELDRRGSEQSDQTVLRLESLQQCIGSLGSSLLQFLTWRYEEEISLEEMSQRSGRSLPAVKKQLWIIRQKLKDCIEVRLASAKSP